MLFIRLQKLLLTAVLAVCLFFNTSARAVVNCADTPACGAAAFSQAAYAFTEAAGTVSATVKRNTCDAANAPAISVNYSFTDDSAVSGSDYNATAGTLTWNANDCSAQTISLALLDDSVYEGGERFLLNISGDVATLGSQAVLVILDGADQTLPPALDPDTGLRLADGGVLVDPATGLNVDANGNLIDSLHNRVLDPLSYLPVTAQQALGVFDLVSDAQGNRFEPLTGAREDSQGQLINPKTNTPLELAQLDLGNLLMNQSSDRIHPAAFNKLENTVNRIQPGWRIDGTTGELFPPAGTVLNMPWRRDPNRPAAITTSLYDCHKGVAVAGNTLGGSVLDDYDAVFSAVGFNCTAGQDNDGIIPVKCGETEFSFAPGRAVQAPPGTPPGLTWDESWNYIFTTLEGRQFTLNGAPKNLRTLLNTVGGEIELVEDGILALISANNGTARARSERTQYVRSGVQQRANTTNEAPGVYINDNNTGYLIYPDNTAQDLFPAVPAPQTFVNEARKFSGVEKVLYRSDGSFWVSFKGQGLRLSPQFNPEVRTLGPNDPSTDPSIVLNPDVTLTYTVQHRQQEVITELRVTPEE